MVSKSKIYVTVFTSGFVLMVFEIVGSRVLAPFLGSSSVVWTSIIGVILGFMSVGYWYGGKMADQHPTVKRLASVLVLAAIAILAMNLGKNFVLKIISGFPLNLMLKSVLSSIILFSIPSFLMAFITPFAIRINMSNVENSGETAGSIYAVSTIGSIAGTFFAGFIFVALFGTNQILWILSVILFVLASLLAFDQVKKNAIWLLILLTGNIYYSAKAHDYVDIDTDYSRIFITNIQYKERDARFLAISGYVNSGMYLDNPNELLFEYTEYYDLVEYFHPEFKTAVMFGGAGYSYPKHFQEKFGNKKLDVVEIDPELTEIAMQYFDFELASSTLVIHQDARTFLSSTEKKYDAVMYDVLTSNLTVPFHLTTRETFELVKNIMTENGVMVLNVLGDVNGVGSVFIKSEIKTIKDVFPQVRIFNAMGTDYNGTTNYVIVAMKSPQNVNAFGTGNEYAKFLQNEIFINNLNEGFVFTDDYAPANYLISE